MLLSCNANRPTLTAIAANNNGLEAMKALVAAVNACTAPVNPNVAPVVTTAALPCNIVAADAAYVALALVNIDAFEIF